MARVAVVLIESSRVALIERTRPGRTYFLFPGGEVEEGESLEQTAMRETREELGLDVQLGPLVAVVEFRGHKQHYFLASITGGAFGTGTGTELSSSAESDIGSYRPVWLDLGMLALHDVRPRALAEAVTKQKLWVTGEVLYIQE